MPSLRGRAGLLDDATAIEGTDDLKFLGQLKRHLEQPPVRTRKGAKARPPMFSTRKCKRRCEFRIQHYAGLVGVSTGAEAEGGLAGAE